MNALIVDDEAPAQKVLKQMLIENCPAIHAIQCANSANEARDILNTYKIDILFLDVNMPLESGFDLLSSIDSYNYAIVFVTGSEEYALRALKATAIDFLLKPIDIEELQNAVRKVAQFQKLRIQNKVINDEYISSINNLSENLTSKKAITKLTLHHLQGFKIISILDIVYIEADGNYSIFHMANREKIVVSKSIGEYQELLDTSRFFKSHKSFVINLKYLKEYSSVDGYFALMIDGTSVIISRRRVEDFLEAVKRFSLIN